MARARLAIPSGLHLSGETIPGQVKMIRSLFSEPVVRSGNGYATMDRSHSIQGVIFQMRLFGIHFAG